MSKIKVVGISEKTKNVSPENWLNKGLAQAARNRPDTSAIAKSLKDSGLEIIPYPYELDPRYLAVLYDEEPTHHACCDVKAAAVISNGYHFVHKTEKAKDPYDTMRTAFESLFSDGIEELVTTAQKDYEAIGNTYIEIERNDEGRIRDPKALGRVTHLNHIPAYTMYRLAPDREEGDYVQVYNENKVFFRKFGSPRRKYEGNDLNEVIHLRDVTPSSYWYGIPSIWAGLAAALGNRAMAEHLLDFFESKGIPSYLLILNGAETSLDTEDEDQLTQHFNALLNERGARIVILTTPENTKSELKALREEMNLDQLDVFRLSNWNEICRVHQVPPRLVGIITAGQLGSGSEGETQFDHFKRLVVRPRQNMWENLFRKVFFENNSKWAAWRIQLKEVDLADFLRQQQANVAYIRSGVYSINDVLAGQGKPPVEGGDERFIVAGGIPVRIQDIGKINLTKPKQGKK